MTKHEYNKKWRLEHPEYMKSAIKACRDRCRKFVQEAKEKPCMDCQKTFPYCCMDFDHVRGEKEFDIATGVMQFV